MPVIRIFAGADIGEDKDSGSLGFYFPDGPLDNSVGIERFRCFGILPGRDTKEEDSPDSLFLQPKHCRADTTQRVPELAGHGRNRGEAFCILIDKEGHHEIGLPEVVLL
jgi:hypothetical protein